MNPLARHLPRCTLLGFLGIVALVAAVVVLAGAVRADGDPAPAQSARLDFGDAPDGGPAGYLSNPAAVGVFPSRRASRGPSHRLRRRLRLGVRWSGERDSRQVDRDRDDGASFRGGACSRRATVLVVIDARSLPRRLFRRRTRTRIYVNAWFDWNRDGDWADGTDGCAPEWGVQNLALRPRELGPGRQAVLPIRLKSGRQVDELWWRVTLTLGERVSSPSGRGLVSRGRPRSFRYGETEDFHHLGLRGARRALGNGAAFRPLVRAAAPFLAFACSPDPLIMRHGTAQRVAVLQTGAFSGIADRDRLISPRGSESVRVRAPPTTTTPSGDREVVVRSLEKHQRSPRLESLTFVIRWKVGERRANSLCDAHILHRGFLFPRRASQRQTSGDPAATVPGAPPPGGGGGGATPQCRDGKDNEDGDGRIDHTSNSANPDFGCVSPDDDTEFDKLATWPFTCGSGKRFVDVRFPEGSVEKHQLERNPVLHSGLGPGPHGPIPLGTAVCGTGASTSLFDGKDGAAPTFGGTLPAATAPAGEDVFRFAADTTDSDPGGPASVTLTVRVAFDPR